MARNTRQKSTHGVDIAADLLGDRWSLLILHNMTLRGMRSFKELLESGEGIATNMLSSRLKKLLAHKVIEVRREPWDRRRLNYQLTSKGRDLTPALAEMVLWSVRYSTRRAGR